MNINIGILGTAEGWKLMLQQIGLPFKAVTHSLKTDEFSAVVVSDGIGKNEIEMLHRYLAHGGAVLCSAKVYSDIYNIKTRSKNIDFFFGDDSVFNSAGIIDVSAECRITRNANGLKTASGKYSAYIGTDKGCIIALPFDPAEMVKDGRSAVKSFYSPERRLPFEKVSLVSKGELRILVSEGLEFLHHCRGLPFIHLWPFPNGAPSIFCFRIDTDGGSDEQMKSLSRTVHQEKIPATWFADVKSHEKDIRQFTKMHRQEIAVHCYEHKVFQDYNDNLNNLRKAKGILHGVRLNAKGFAAPYGIWSEDLGRAIKDCGFEYSSEFCYDYDNMPSLPHSENFNGVLQIPIHPICIGSLKRHGYSEQQMLSYFDAVIQRKLILHEPIILYHHPKDENYLVLSKIFQKIRHENVPVKTMYEYARWWKNRISTVPVFQYIEGKVYIRGIRPDKSLYVRITWPDRAQTIIPAAGKIETYKIKRNRKPPGWIMPEDYLRMRRFNYRIPLIRSLDALNIFFRRNRI